VVLTLGCYVNMRLGASVVLPATLIDEQPPLPLVVLGPQALLFLGTLFGLRPCRDLFLFVYITLAVALLHLHIAYDAGYARTNYVVTTVFSTTFSTLIIYVLECNNRRAWVLKFITDTQPEVVVEPTKVLREISTTFPFVQLQEHGEDGEFFLKHSALGGYFVGFYVLAALKRILDGMQFANMSVHILGVGFVAIFTAGSCQNMLKAVPKSAIIMPFALWVASRVVVLADSQQPTGQPLPLALLGPSVLSAAGMVLGMPISEILLWSFCVSLPCLYHVVMVLQPSLCSAAYCTYNPVTMIAYELLRACTYHQVAGRSKPLKSFPRSCTFLY